MSDLFAATCAGLACLAVAITLIASDRSDVSRSRAEHRASCLAAGLSWQPGVNHTYDRCVGIGGER